MAFHQGVGYVFDRDQFGGFLDMIVERDERVTTLEFDLFGLEEGDSETVQALENISQVENQLPCAGTSGQDMSTSCVPSTVQQNENVRVDCAGGNDPATVMEQSTQSVESCEPSTKKSRKKGNVVKSKKKAGGKKVANVARPSSRKAAETAKFNIALQSIPGHEGMQFASPVQTSEGGTTTTTTSEQLVSENITVNFNQPQDQPTETPQQSEPVITEHTLVTPQQPQPVTTEQTIATPGQPRAIIPVDESQSSTSVGTTEMVVDDLRNQISHVEKLREIIQDCRSGVNRQTFKIITKALNGHPKPSYYVELSKLESRIISLCGKITQAGLDQEHYLNELESLLKGSLFKIHPHVVKVDAHPKSDNFTDKVVENIYKRKLVTESANASAVEKDDMMSFIAPTYYQNRRYKSLKDASLTEDQVVAIYDAYVWLMADKEVANRFNFESVESKEAFLVYLKNKKMTHSEFFTSVVKFLKGLSQQRKNVLQKYKEGYIDATEVERLFELQRQGAHTKADNVLKRV